VAARAVALCRGKTHILDSLVYDIVQDPTLGNCAWNKNRLAVGVDAIPTAELGNNYGRCDFTYTNGSSVFPRKLVIGDVGTITGVEAIASCGPPVGTLKKPCGNLEVVEFEYPLSMNGGTEISVDQGKSYTVTATCTGSASFFALICKENASSEGCSVKIGSTTYSGGHNNSPGCRLTAPAVGSIVEIIKAKSRSGDVMGVKCLDQYNGSMCTTS
jgi:hypothetical protein